MRKVESKEQRRGKVADEDPLIIVCVDLMTCNDL